MKIRFLGESDPIYLLHGKVYDVISIEKEWYRIIDEEGEDYLYPPDIFEIVDDSPIKRLKEIKMIENEDWNWSQETLKAIIQQIVERKEEYEKNIKNDIDQGIVLGYEFVLDSIKNQLEARGYNFEDWLNC